MQKKTYSGIQLNCVFQNVTELDPSVCLTGIISRNESGFRFEEEIKKGRPPRNPKLYDGEYVSLVRMVNGKYQMHMKTIDASAIENRRELAFNVYTELLSAFDIID